MTVKIKCMIVVMGKRSNEGTTKTVLFGTTVPTTARHFLADQMHFLAENGWRIHLATSPGDDLDAIRVTVRASDQITLHEIPMERQPSLLRDFASLRSWVRLIREIRPNVVMIGTPKAGLLGSIAARWVGIRNRIYLVHGLRLEGMSGFPAALAAIPEWIACSAATQVVCVSPSLKTAMIRRNLVHHTKCFVVSNGSANGVDLTRFRPASPPSRERARRGFGIPENAQVIGFAGRLTHDKGIEDLLEAMKLVRESFPKAHLLVAGSEDMTAPLSHWAKELLNSTGIIQIGHCEDMPNFYHALDLFCLPSHREGLGQVNLEAAASGIPVVTTSVTGCVDSVLDGETGRLCRVRDPADMADVITSLLMDDTSVRRMSSAGREWVENNFSQRAVWDAQLAFLNGLA